MKSIGQAVFFVFALGATPSSAGEKIVWVEYPESGAVLGQGYDLLEDRPATGTCVNFVPIQDPSQSMQYRFDEVTSHTQVQSVTNISAAGSMKMAILKATARLSFLSDETFQLDTQKFLLTASVVNSALFAAPSIDFKAGGKVVGADGKDGMPAHDYSAMTEVMLKPDVSIFDVARCGQGYVGAIVSGAALDSFLTMSKSDASSLADLKGSLEADIGGIFSVSGSFGQKLTSSKVQQDTSVSVFKNGGQGSQIAYDLDGLKAAVAAMPLEAATSPKPIRVAIVPYGMLSKIPSAKTYSAELFAEAVAAYFMAIDVFQNTSSVIDEYRSFSEAATPKHPLFRKALERYVDLNLLSMKSANELSQVLVLCQEQLSQANKGQSVAPAAADQETNLANIARLLGVSPSQEDHQTNFPSSLFPTMISTGALPPSGTLPTLPLAAISLDKLKEANVALDALYQTAVTTLTSAPSAGADANGANQLTACQPKSSDAFVSNPILNALTLAAKEVGIRPIYWADLDVQEKADLAKMAADIQPGGSKTNKELTLEAVPTLEEYVNHYRATKMLRDVCQKSFAHPICNNADSFLKLAGIDIIEGDFRPLQLAKDLEGDNVKP